MIDLDRGDFYARGVKKVMISRFLFFFFFFGSLESMYTFGII